MGEFKECSAGLDDPRAVNARRHDLIDILVIALCTFLCGGESCVDMEEFGRAKEAFLRQFLRLENGIPSHDTFSRVFRRLDPEPFRACFAAVLDRLAVAHRDVIAIDGKTLRRSFDRACGASPLHLVSAWACEQRLVLGQVAADGKSNEITAVPKLLEPLALDGAIVTADAMHCQRATAARITARGGACVLALKGNQGTLYDDVRTFLDDPEAAVATATAVDGGHGRIEQRRSAVSADVAWLGERHAWPGLAAIGKVTAVREGRGEPTTTETRYYLLSTALGPERFGAIVRAHWGIENRLHWVLDVAMDEDRARNRKGHGPENLAVLRRLALNLVRREASNGSTRVKLKRAGWSDAFLSKLLTQT